MVTIGIDQSLRSTGIVALDENFNLVDFGLIISRTGNERGKARGDIQVKNDEALIVYNSHTLIEKINRISESHAIDAIAIEGLSHGSVSAYRDMIAANQWMMRCMVYQKVPNVLVGVIPPTVWRSEVIPKEEKKKLVEKYGKKLYLKKGCVEKLPDDVREAFQEYVKSMGFKKDSIYDLCDAYFIAKYRIGLK